MKVLIVGGGKVGRNLAKYLSDQGGHDVTLVEKQESVALLLEETLPGVRVVEGDGCDPAVLREIGAELLDAVAAVTGEDEDNLVVSLLAKREFRVRRVAARINNPKNAWLFSRRMGVDVPLDTAQQIARGLEADISIGAVVSLLRLREGRTTLVELTVAPDSGAVGKTIATLGLPPECVIVAVLRGEEVIIPAGDTVFHANDQVITIVRRERESDLMERFR